MTRMTMPTSGPTSGPPPGPPSGTAPTRPSYLPAVWVGPDGEPVACVEKLEVLRQNLAELREMAQEALEDAVVMGCDEAQAREALAALIASLDPPFA